MTKNKPNSYNLLLQIFFAPIIYSILSIKVIPPIWIYVLLLMIVCVIYYTLRQYQRRKKIGTVFKSVFVSLFTVSLSFVLVRTFIASARFVVGDSMLPAFQEKERLVADQTSYIFNSPSRGDIILFKYNNVKDDALARIIGLPGETIEIKEGQVYINNQKMQENYLSPSVPLEFYKSTVIPTNHYFVLGDNRGQSWDSRQAGTIPRSQIIGKITGRFYPFNKFGVFKSPEYKAKSVSN